MHVQRPACTHCESLEYRVYATKEEDGGGDAHGVNNSVLTNSLPPALAQTVRVQVPPRDLRDHRSHLLSPLAPAVTCAAWSAMDGPTCAGTGVSFLHYFGCSAGSVALARLQFLWIRRRQELAVV